MTIYLHDLQSVLHFLPCFQAANRELSFVLFATLRMRNEAQTNTLATQYIIRIDDSTAEVYAREAIRSRWLRLPIAISTSVAQQRSVSNLPDRNKCMVVVILRVTTFNQQR